MDIIKVGDIFHSNKSGDMIVISYKDFHNVEVLFINTMYRVVTNAYSLRKGQVRDKLHPNLYGVGYIGEGEFNSNHSAIHRWRGMLDRCYNEETHKKYPSYKGCSVCEEWHNFQNFAKWFEENYPKDGGVYQLDKDIKVEGNKIYSPDTCLFVTQEENMAQAHAKNYKVKDPYGQVIDVYNLSAFCRDNGLHIGHMNQVMIGNRKHHRGWTSGVTDVKDSTHQMQNLDAKLLLNT
tara:strand:+ start:30924 stop:31628 length:705 start_codon:yes stop_codon:yes gene_type:complete